MLSDWDINLRSENDDLDRTSSGSMKSFTHPGVNSTKILKEKISKSKDGSLLNTVKLPTIHSSKKMLQDDLRKESFCKPTDQKQCALEYRYVQQVKVTNSQARKPPKRLPPLVTIGRKRVRQRIEAASSDQGTSGRCGVTEESPETENKVFGKSCFFLVFVSVLLFLFVCLFIYFLLLLLLFIFYLFYFL